VVRRLVFAGIAALLFAGCSEDRLPEIELSGPVMGTSFSIKLVDSPGTIDRDALGTSIAARLEDIEQRFSTYRPSSELVRVNATLSTDWIPVSGELCEVVETALGYSRQTHGAFDVTVGPLVLLWGFGAEADRSAPPDDALVAEARSSVGYEKLQTDCAAPALRKSLPGVNIDLSAFVKGYAVDRIADLLDAGGLDNFLVEIGGELRMRGHNAARKPWSIAIEKPEVASRVVQSVIQVTDRGMATSGDYRNFFEHDGVRYSHTIDPETGRPVTHDAAAVTVIGDTAAEADALATALLVMGPDEGLAFAQSGDIAAYFLLRDDPDVKVRMTPGFKALAN
jgi:thiamine biosynthesis lipoprotein